MYSGYDTGVSSDQIAANLSDVRQRLVMLQRQNDSRGAERNRSVAFLKSELRNSLQHLRQLQLTSKDEHRQLLARSEQNAARSFHIQNSACAKNLHVAKQVFLENVSKLEPAWLESQAERKAEKLKQTSMHIERLQQHSEIKSSVVANLRDLDQTLRSKQLELESLMEHQRIEAVKRQEMEQQVERQKQLDLQLQQQRVAAAMKEQAILTAQQTSIENTPAPISTVSQVSFQAPAINPVVDSIVPLPAAQKPVEPVVPSTLIQPNKQHDAPIVEKSSEKSAEKSVEKSAAKSVEKSAEKSAEKSVEKSAEKSDKSVEKSDQVEVGVEQSAAAAALEAKHAQRMAQLEQSIAKQQASKILASAQRVPEAQSEIIRDVPGFSQQSDTSFTHQTVAFANAVIQLSNFQQLDKQIRHQVDVVEQVSSHVAHPSPSVEFVSIEKPKPVHDSHINDEPLHVSPKVDAPLIVDAGSSSVPVLSTNLVEHVENSHFSAPSLKPPQTDSKPDALTESKSTHLLNVVISPTNQIAAPSTHAQSNGLQPLRLLASPQNTELISTSPITAAWRSSLPHSPSPSPSPTASNFSFSASPKPDEPRSPDQESPGFAQPSLAFFRPSKRPQPPNQKAPSLPAQPSSSSSDSQSVAADVAARAPSETESKLLAELDSALDVSNEAVLAAAQSSYALRQPGVNSPETKQHSQSWTSLGTRRPNKSSSLAFSSSVPHLSSFPERPQQPSPTDSIDESEGAMRRRAAQVAAAAVAAEEEEKAKLSLTSPSKSSANTLTSPSAGDVLQFHKPKRQPIAALKHYGDSDSEGTTPRQSSASAGGASTAKVAARVAAADDDEFDL